ncbi:MAG TPA: serine hydrolase domain-containing protein [Streptosporangiaceae bacterium]
MPDQFSAVDELAGAFQRGGGQPGIAYGVVAGGRLVHAGGCGERWVGGLTPDATTVFRIASMTKSFTAAAVLALRDDGRLALDDPAARYVPELRGVRLPSPDSPQVSIRHLLTMTAGFPTDDPWGDRQQGLPLASFAQLLAGGLSFAWAPGTRFEYSNLGYAILGRVISAVSGMSYLDFVSERLLRPLAMTRTGFDTAPFDVMDLARGYRRSADRWEELAPDGNGAFAPMGGVFSCVADLARWVSGFTAAFPPAEPAAGGPHPLARATRREMQLPQAMLPPPALDRLPGDPASGGPVGYGFGLFIDRNPRGRVVGHSGGYPGFGSNMRWHPATGLGVIVLANSTYAAAPTLAARMLDAVLRLHGPAWTAPGGPAAMGIVGAPGGAWPATLTAQREVNKLLGTWSDAEADRLFSPNVAQDEPYPERRRKIGLVRERIGQLAVAADRPAEFDSPAHCRWWLAGERGVVQAEIRLTPERDPRIQSFTLAVPPAPDSPLGQVVTALISLLNGGARDWPPTVPVAGSVVTGVLLRQFRMAAAWTGPCRVGAFRAGNGQTSSTVELDGETGRLLLSVVISRAGHLRQADILVRP